MAFDLVRLIQNAPTILKIATSAEQTRRAIKDSGSLLPLIGFATNDLIEAGGIYDARFPDAARGLIAGAGEAWAKFNGDMGPPELDVAPWQDFSRHFYALKPAVNPVVICILGGKGFGKTQLAVKIAATFADRLGYRPECIGFWEREHTRPPWMKRISMKRLVKRMAVCADYLDQEGEDANDDGLTESDIRGKKAVAKAPVTDAQIERFSRRIVVVDEAALFFSAAADSQQANRAAAKNLNNQARHLESIFIFICQNLSEMPTYLQSSGIHFYKWAPREVVEKDYKPGMKREYAQRWAEVLACLDAVRSGSYVVPLPPKLESSADMIRQSALAHPYYRDMFPDIRAWAHVVADDVGGHGYRGVCPFTQHVEPANQPNTDTLHPDSTIDEDEE